MEVPSTDIILILVCIAGSAFFSSAETALTSLTDLRLIQLIEAGGPGTRILKLWQERPNQVLTSILVGNNLANMLASALATAVTARLLPGEMGEVSSSALAVAVGVMTLLVLIFGEIFPKTYARHNAERFLKLGPLLLLFYNLFAPLTWVFVRFSRGVARLLRAKITTDGPMVRVEDIQHMVKIGAANEAIDREEARYLSGVLEMSETVVREIMVPRTESEFIEISSGLETVLEIVRKEHFSRYPVYEDGVDEIVGVLYVKDLLDVLGREGGAEGFNLRGILRPALFVAETRNIRDVLQDFRTNKVHIAVVVDEFGGTAGIVSLEDVIEEIVGEIYDEYDDEDDRPVQELGEGRYLLEGAASLRDVEHALQVEFPDNPEYDSVAGFLTCAAGGLPEPGFSCEHGGYRFVVREADDRRIILIEAESLAEADDGDHQEVAGG